MKKVNYSSALFLFLLTNVDAFHFLLGCEHLLEFLMVDIDVRVHTTGMRESLLDSLSFIH